MAAVSIVRDPEEERRLRWQAIRLQMGATADLLAGARGQVLRGEAVDLLATVYAATALLEEATRFAAWVQDRHSLATGAARDPAMIEEEGL